MIALDYTYRIEPTAVKAAGASMVCRYLKPDSAPAYRIGLTEYRELTAAGIQVTLNWEYDARDWLGGAARGTTHGKLAVDQARALGYPAGHVIVGSADFDMTRDEWTGAGRAYAVAFATAVRAGGFRPGVYGPWDVLGWVHDEGIMDAFWQARMSWAFSQGRNAHDWPGAHLIQRRHVTVAGQDCDLNDIMINNWGGDEMDLSDKVDNTATPNATGGRNVDQILGDVWNNVHGIGRGEIGPADPRYPKPGTPARAALELPAVVGQIREAVSGLAAGQVSQDAVNAAVRAALADPAVIAPLVTAVGDALAARLAQ